MHSEILNPEIQKYIQNHVGTDVSRLALVKNPFPDTDWIEILSQIASKTKARDKLPLWYHADGILYPPKISIEQASSELTAAYKSNLVAGENLIDLSGGFGVDDYFFSKRVQHVIHCELDPLLSGIVRHNFEQLKIRNVECVTGDSSNILEKRNQHFDWIYVDPSRRNEAKEKVFMLKDCLPDVPGKLGYYFSFSKNILIKTAPILDITAGLTELKNVKAVHIVAVENEVKELLWTLEKDFSDDFHIHTANITKKHIEIFDFCHGRRPAVSVVGAPEKYLYEPNGAIMKSGGFEEIGLQYGLKKLHRHSHLYTSTKQVAFPGRVFEIQRNIGYSKNNMKNFLENGKFNVTVRNFPHTVEEIRKKWKIKDGGETYCFFTTDADNNKIVLLCSKINI